jgi:hypothetical protein
MTRYLATAAAVVLAAALLTGGGVAAISRGTASAAESRTLVPAPAVDEPRARVSGTETAILSGGCFWGVQAVFQHVKGVREVISGYTGGSAATAHYEVVSSGATGTRNRSRSFMTRGRLLTERCCEYTSSWRPIRPSWITRDPTTVRSIGVRSGR